MANYFGRETIYTSYDESNLNRDTIKKIIEESIPIHTTNSSVINTLYEYYKGDQPILEKTKQVRTNINNIIVENNAYEIVEFKKGYVFGEPIQYVSRNDGSSDEISALNNYMSYEDKASKDKDLAEWLYICGIGHRIVLPDDGSSQDESPFEIHNLDPRYTFVVHSKKIGNKPILGVTYVEIDNPENSSTKIIKYYVYTKNKYFEFVSEGYTGTVNFVVEKPYYVGYMPIFEYSLNNSKLGLIEVVQSILDTLNKINSNEMDDIEQFVNSLLVFKNQNVTATDLTELLEMGAVLLQTTDPARPADLTNINQKLSSSDVKIYYERLYNNALTICGIPRMNDKPSGGDTGQARLLGEGWTMADERAKQDELSFKKTEKQVLEIILRICKMKNSDIKNIMAKDIDIKFTRNKSDNMLVKAQSLQIMIQAGVAPEVAFNVCGLFSDSTDVVNQSISFFGKDFWNKETKETNTNTDNSETVIPTDNQTGN